MYTSNKNFKTKNETKTNNELYNVITEYYIVKFKFHKIFSI